MFGVCLFVVSEQPWGARERRANGPLPFSAGETTRISVVRKGHSNRRGHRHPRQ